MLNNNLITVIIATYNRYESLKDTLDSLLSQEGNNGFNYEVIVADNNSKDKTKETVNSYMPKFNGRLRYLFEPRQGKSYALNSGIKESNGEIIAFTDDDCMPEKKWIQKIFNKFKEDYKLDGLVGGVNWTNGARFYARKDALRGNGGNMSIKKNILLKVNGFDANLGVGSMGCSAEDWDITYRILKAGGKIAVEDSILVTHKNRAGYSEYLKYFHRDMQGFTIGCMKHFLVYKDPLALKKIYWRFSGFIKGLLEKIMKRDFKAAKTKYVAIIGILKGLIRGFFIFGIKYKNDYK